MRKKILLGCYILVSGVLLLYLLFPDDVVRDHLTNRINRNISGSRVSIGSLRFRFPLSLSLQNVTLFNEDIPLVTADRVNLSPRWLTFLANRKVFKFKGQLCQGNISGSGWIEFDSDGPEASASATFSNLRLEQLQLVRLQPGLDLSGSFSGSFQMDASSQQLSTGSGSIAVTNFSLILPDSLSDIQRLLNMERFEFEHITADFYIDGSNLELQGVGFEGSQLNGHASGRILLRNPVSRSVMDLEIGVTPLLSSALSEINELLFRVSGTIEEPKLTIVPAR